ncbi:Exodeoxyribonuclease V beta chain [Borrelia coriaceae ATCC 43381]|uniref:Exodeoxyribonuclease V beta chain n=2 Tax=Borrelia coriaceae TaxID=144 RepID=W5T0I4_9SPIR|nr:Exodeoxyribonuclease V beta chain [Borrelia coriaceae ATCC 43381]
MFDNIYNKTLTSEIEHIEFTKAKTDPKNDENKIFINDQEIEVINIIETEGDSNIFQKTALTIKYLLTNGKIYDHNTLRQIKESDIKVLCRTSKEINLIDKELKNHNIKTNKIEESFFKTKEFSEIFYLIKCLDRKQNFQTLNYILTSKIINLPWTLHLSLIEQNEIKHIEEAISNIIYLLENQEITLIKAIDEIISNKNLWLKLAKDLQNTTFTEFAQSKKSYKETLINEKKFEELKNHETSLDFISKIYYEEKNIESLIGTLEDLILNQDIEQYEGKTTTQDCQSIEILTIHKSKGLSFNIVFLISDAQQNDSLVKKSDTFYKFYLNNKIEYDFLKLKENQQFAKNKIFNEEKNIFYVGTTRSRFALFIINKGIIINKMLELAKIKTIDKINLNFNVYNLIKANPFNKLYINDNKKIKLISPPPINKHLFRKEYTHSYTSLASSYNPNYHTNQETRDDEIYDNNAICTEGVLPRGKDIGNILHDIMKDINFSDAKNNFNNFQKINITLIQQKIEHFNSKLNTTKIQEMLTTMIYNILNTKIKFIDARLCDIQKLQKEMEFLIKINTKTYERKSLFKVHNKLDLTLHGGYIKGIIDLIFKINHKVYILDYKTNYLGENLEDYNLTNLTNKMQQEKYDLQYKIYTLGIKEILFKNEEEYKKHFGGVIYLFTRAFQKNIKEQSKTQNGIYSTIPNFKELDLEQIYLQSKY